jgi:signal transduction histidine kinase
LLSRPRDTHSSSAAQLGHCRDDGGSGLGLSIVDEVVRAHGGSMSITQSPLGGARIQVTLPADEG